MSGPGSSRAAGRPAGPDPDTLAKGRLYLTLREHGVDVAMIMSRSGATRSEVYRAMELARGSPVTDKAETRQSDPVADAEASQPRPPRRLSRRTVQYRAWAYAEQRPIGALGLAANAFWIRLVVAAHEDGDGFHLCVGRPGYRFQERDDLADLFGRREVLEIDNWLEALFLRGRLINVDGVDIGIPRGLGLTPGENARGRLVVPRAAGRPPANAEQIPLHFPLHLVKSLGANGVFSPDSESGKTPISPDSGPAISPDSEPCAASLSLSSKSQENQEVRKEESESPRADASANESGKTPIFPDTDQGVFPDSESGENTPLASTGRTVKKTALPAGWKPSAEGEREARKRGFDPATLASRFRTFYSANGARRADWDFAYLNWIDREPGFGGKADAARQSPAPAAAPAPPLSDAEQALMARLRPFDAAFWQDRTINPIAPSLADFGAGSPVRELAYRWLDQGEAWVKEGHPRDLKPPDFGNVRLVRSRFVADLLAAEEALMEALTSPEAPDTS